MGFKTATRLIAGALVVGMVAGAAPAWAQAESGADERPAQQESAATAASTALAGQAPALQGTTVGFTLVASRSLDYVQGQAATPARPQRRLPPAAYSKTGYIDSAIIGNSGRVRLDLGFDNSSADRGEFFYAKCGCYREVGLDILAPGPAPRLNGADPVTTPFIETNVDYVDVWVSGEYQISDRFSGFAEGMIRSISPEVNESATGIGDLTVGFKAAILAEAARYVTFQLKATVPTGNALKGLGTANTWWEPGLLFYQELNDRTTLAGEFRVSVPVGGSSDAGVPELTAGDLGGGDFSSTVVRYGIGGSYDVNPGARLLFSPVVELVAWSVAGGYTTTTEDGTAATAGADRANTTIVNLKIGARLRLDDHPGSVYVGWGTAVTDTAWYENIFRAEYRYTFF